METIKIQYLNDEIERLRYIDGKSDWIDLHLAEDVTLHAGEFRLLPLGVAMALPEGYDPETRVVAMTAEAPQSGSYVIVS